MSFILFTGAFIFDYFRYLNNKAINKFHKDHRGSSLLNSQPSPILRFSLLQPYRILVDKTVKNRPNRSTNNGDMTELAKRPVNE